MKKILCVLFTCLPGLMFSQDYRASLIPDSLKLNANAVKRFEELHIIIKGIDKAVIKHKYAITVLNEDGDDFAYYVNSYSNLRSLSDISGRLLDADGKVLKTIKKKDISDMSTSDDETMLTDTRVKRYAFYNKNYPYTVEFEDEQDLNGIFHLSAWHPIEDEKFSVQQSRFIVEVPADYQLRFKQLNYTGSPVITNNKNTIYTWEMVNRMPMITESYQPSAWDIAPLVFVAPSQFSIANYTGNMSTWQGLGQFVMELNKKRDELPESIKAEVHKLADGITNKTDKIKALYSYLQKNTRYIGIQLGIGSWQPFEAKYVAEKKYGDCKALSNYMVSLLKEAGIKAYYVLATAGDDNARLAEDFPAPYYFNHAICCVPNGKDTMWLECTSQTQPAGFMGSFTSNKKVLLIDEDGGHLVSTPSYLSDDNRQFRRVNATVDAEGNMLADVYTHATGEQQESMHGLIYGSTKEQRQKYLNNVLSLPTYEVDKSDYKETPGSIPFIDEYLHVKASNYATVSGKRLFITPNLFNRSGTKMSPDAERKYPIKLSSVFKDIDTIQIAVPPGYTPEAVPKDVSIQTQFGKFDINYKVNDNSIEVIRSQVRDRREFPPSEYPSLIKYFDAVYKADHSRIVFVKKEG
ncbi:MAG: DUF3857 domain-containing protein [Bacteroidota bacterium]